MSNTAIAHKCVCIDPKLGIVDGDTDAVYCDNCDGVLGDIASVSIMPNVSPLLNDKHWNDQLSDRKNAYVINGNHYRTGSESDKYKGMGGSLHLIKVHATGKIIETTNLWHQGTVPEAYSELLPNNASFVRKIEVK